MTTTSLARAKPADSGYKSSNNLECLLAGVHIKAIEWEAATKPIVEGTGWFDR